MSRARGSVWSRVGRLEGERKRDAGCRVCRGAGYPGLFLQRGEGAPRQRVGVSGCAGCGRISVGKVIVLGGSAADEFAGGDSGASP